VTRRRVADLLDHAGDLVTGNERVRGASPLVATAVDVGVADAGVVDAPEDVVRAEVSSFDRRPLEGGTGALGAVGGDWRHAA
jgi:hypothetical protein